MVAKSCVVAEGTTQLGSPASPSASANSTGVVLCGAKSAGTLWMSTLARLLRRQSGWTRPEHTDTSLIPPLQASNSKAQDLCMHTFLHPQSWAATASVMDLESDPGGPQCPGWFLSPRKELIGDGYGSEWLPAIPPGGLKGE